MASPELTKQPTRGERRDLARSQRREREAAERRAQLHGTAIAPRHLPVVRPQRPIMTALAILAAIRVVREATSAEPALA